jgi:glycosyltransferase involved in cell wall biosynthesis
MRGASVIDVDLDAHLRRPHVLYDAVVISRPHNFARYAHTVRRHQPHAALIYDAEALFHIRLERQAQLASDPGRAASIRAEAQALLTLETVIRGLADGIVCVSKEEAAHFERCNGQAPVVVLPPFVSAAKWTAGEFEHRSAAVFVAGWLAGDGSPNVDGLCWFAAEVLPRMRAAGVHCELRISGANPPAAVSHLRGDGIRILGHVPDLTSLYAGARVAIVPIRFGAGVKVKAIEALQHGVPLVATTVGAEGLGLAGSGAACISDTPEGFAAALVSLLTDRTCWERARASIATVLSRLGPADGPTWASAIEAGLLARAPGEIRTRVDLSGWGR